MSDDVVEPTLYSDVILWELPVQFAAHLFLRPGDSVLDVGGNTGGVAIAFSRMVTKAGQVFSFECNPKMIRWINRDCAANDVSNVLVVPLAAYKHSGDEVQFHLDESYYSAASSIYGESGTEITVETISLDDFCREKAITPALIKIDVEGGEADVLDGAKETIERARPIVILEFSPGARNPILVLKSLNYDVYDLNNYSPVDVGYYDQPIATNVVGVPSERGVVFQFSNTRVFTGGVIEVEEGFSVAEFEIRYSGEGVGALTCTGPDGETLAYFQASFRQLQHHSCSAIPFESRAGTVTARVSCVQGEGSIEIAQCRLSRLNFVDGRGS